MINRLRAFSAVELLVCLALVAMLAAIAVPNFMVASTAADVSQAKADMQALKVGLEAYKVDGGAYPWQCSFPSALKTFPEQADGNGNRPTLERLTTPVSYLGGATTFYDPFDANAFYEGPYGNSETTPTGNLTDACKQYWYTARNLKDTSQWDQNSPQDVDPYWYFLESSGPDRHHNLNWQLLNQWTLDLPAFRAQSGRFLYDPTNGTVSRGSIWEVGGVVQGTASSFGLTIIEANSSRVADWDGYR